MVFSIVYNMAINVNGTKSLSENRHVQSQCQRGVAPSSEGYGMVRKELEGSFDTA